MPPKILEQAVSSPDDGATYDFACPGIVGSRCGGPEGPFTSTGWPTRKTALARGAEHLAEHKGEGVTSTLEEFREKHGLTVTDDGAAVVKLGGL